MIETVEDPVTPSRGTVRVLIATTEGPVAIEALAREPAEIGKSFVVLADDRYTEWQPLSRFYNSFVSRTTGLIGRLFGHDAFRLIISGRIDDGFSWQLGVLVAHALEAAGRLAQRDDAADIVILATGEVGWGALTVGKVGYVERKLTLALDRLKQEMAAGHRVIALWPKDNNEDAAPRIASLRQLGIETVDVEAVAAAFAYLGLWAPSIDRVKAASAEQPSWNGSPFRGLEVFDADHRAVFFGRGQAREETLERLRRAAGQDCAFLLIYGSSGSGKSSLVRAGLVGDIKEIASEAAAWRDCVVQAGKAGSSPLEALARALCAAVPELGVDAGTLAERIRTSQPEAAAAIKMALAERRGLGREKLILLVDQFEELFLWVRDQRSEAAAAEREQFGAMLDALARSGAAWVLATMRSDLLPLLEHSPQLSRLAADERRYSLKAPSRAELREIVQRPAAVAGLQLTGKDRSGLPLVDVLVDAGAANPGSLPLLQFALARLYDNEGHTGQITYDAYSRIGGIEGAIGRWADDRVASLGDDVEMTQAVDDVLLALGRTDGDGGRVVARTALLETDFATPARGKVITTLEKARLVTLDAARDATGERTSVRVSHEALLTHWRRARQVFEAYAGKLDLRDRLNDDAQRWVDRDHDESLLLRAGRLLNEAEELTAGGRVSISPAAIEFIRVSARKAQAERDWEAAVQAEAEQRRHEREAEQARRLADAQALASANRRAAQRTKVGLGAALLLALVAGGFAVYAQAQRSAATENEGKATAAAHGAELALQDLVREARSARDQSRNAYGDLEDLAATIVRHSSQLAGIGARTKRAAALDNLGKAEDATGELDAILNIVPHKIPAIRSRAYQYLNVGRGEDAIREIQKILDAGAATTVDYANVAIAQALARRYDAAIAAAKNAKDAYRLGEGISDKLVSPDIERATRHNATSASGSDLRVALGYYIALFHAIKGDDAFEYELHAADADNPNPMGAMSAYLAVLNWAWQCSVWQERSADGAPRDYGLYAFEGALWERTAAIQPSYFDWARRAYEKFRDADARRHEPRYEALSRFVAGRLMQPHIIAAAPEVPPAPGADELVLQANEMNAARSGSSTMAYAAQVFILTKAIDLIDADRTAAGPARTDLTDRLVSLLLRRADWRQNAGDLTGAREDAERVIAINPRIAEAHWRLGRSTTGAKARQAHYEEAFRLDPNYEPALRDLSRTISANLPKDPTQRRGAQERALGLLLHWLDLEAYADSDDYEEIARLQLQLEKTDDAMATTRLAIAMEPARPALYELREAIERAQNVPDDKRTIHLAEGYRHAADAATGQGEDATRLSLYLRALKTIAAAKADDDATFELEASVRSLSEFLADAYPASFVKQFWQSLTGATLADEIRARIQQEAAKFDKG